MHGVASPARSFLAAACARFEPFSLLEVIVLRRGSFGTFGGAGSWCLVSESGWISLHSGRLSRLSRKLRERILCALVGLRRQTRTIEERRIGTRTRHRGRSFYGRYDINYDRINTSFRAADRFRHRKLVLLACAAWLRAASLSAATARAAIVVAARDEGKLSTLRCYAFCRDVFVVAAAE